jgi:hypothetical protein
LNETPSRKETPLRDARDRDRLPVAQTGQVALDDGFLSGEVLSSLKTLAVARKLAVPVLQVNIARKQVNVAGVCPAVEDGG